MDSKANETKKQLLEMEKDLSSMTERLKTGVSGNVDQLLDSFYNQKKDLQKIIDKLETKGELAVDEAQAGVKMAFNDLKETYHSILSVLKQ